MKKYLLAIAALFVIVVAGSAFTNSGDTQKANDEVWFEYVPVNGNGPTDPANYEETGMSPACIDESGSLCSVFAEADDNSGDPGDRKPTAASLLAIQNGPGFDDFEEGLVHLRD